MLYIKFLYVKSKNNTNECVYKAETGLQWHKTHAYQRGKGGGEVQIRSMVLIYTNYYT